MDTTLVDVYVDRLERALQDDAAFPELMLELIRDPRVRQPEAAQIAKRFYGDATATTAKKEAFRRIQARHDSLMDYMAKSRAQAGKSAA